jgi:hypothetical protein
MADLELDKLILKESLDFLKPRGWGPTTWEALSFMPARG